MTKRRTIAQVEPNLLDKIITVISPQRGLARQAARRMGAIAGAWTGARFDRKATQTWMVANGSADADSLPDLPTLRIRCRDLMRNAALAGGAVSNLVRDVVGTGLSVHPKPDWEALGMTEDGAIAWAESTYREFELYASSKDCDISRTLNFYEIQSLIFRSMLESGDVFVNLPQLPVSGALYKTRLQVIEADRIQSPNGDGVAVKYFANAAAATNNDPTTSAPVWGGVECDANGAPVAYYILDEHPGALMFTDKPNAWKRYAAFGSRTNRRLILHLFDQERPDQKRGVPYLAPVIEQLKQLSRYTDAEIMAA
ncbi:MAG TPA: phage portal protein, partial [Afipia sp.]